jgi:mycothiol synthase
MTIDVDVPDAPAIAGLAFRVFREPDDWELVTGLLNQARLADGVEEVTTPEGLAVDLGGRDDLVPARDILVAEIDGAPVAFGVGFLLPRAGALIAESWGVVGPAWRRRGIGTALHRANRARLVAQAAVDPRPGPREMRSYAMDSELSQQALLVAEGFVPIRFGFEMRRPLTGVLPGHPLPAGLELRAVVEADHRAIFDADDEAFRDHWGHRDATDTDFTSMFAHPDTDPSLWCVAWDGDQVAGVVMNAVFHRDNEQFGFRRGWLDRVSVRRPWRGRGLAKALCAASFRVLRDAGMDEAWLGVDARNPTGALRLYESIGFNVARRWYAYGRPLDGPAGPDWASSEGALDAT